MKKDRNDKGRVFVGVDGSLASLRALREATAQARQRRAELHVVHVRQPEPTMPAMPFLIPSIPDDSRRDGDPADSPDRAAEELILSCLRDALGALPPGLDVRWRVLVGRLPSALAALGCRDSDLLVVGTRGGRRWRHPRRRSVSRYCAVRARCPVLIVPQDEFARTAQRPRRQRLMGMRDPWREFDRTDEREVHPAR